MTDHGSRTEVLVGELLAVGAEGIGEVGEVLFLALPEKDNH